MSLIGRSVRRLEDPPLLTGQGQFAADISLPNQLHMRVVRSPVAHGRIIGIDVRDAVSMPGVVAVWTTADVHEIPPIDFRQEGLAELYPYRQPILATNRVRYVGEPVAVVFAEDSYMVEDAADMVYVDIEELPAVLDPLSEPAAFDDVHSTAAGSVAASYGDIERAFSDAVHVVSLEVRIGRHTGVPMETRGGVAVLDRATDRLHLYGAAKVPHYNRLAIAKMLDLPPDRVALHEGHVGGGFGVRGELYPEDVLMCSAAMKLLRPIKWIEDRKEHMTATNHSRDQIHRIEAAVDEQGIVQGLRDVFWLDQGAYIRTHGATVPNLTVAMLPGPYVIPAYDIVGHIRLTNKTPAGTYRAPGRYEATFARERLMDKVSHVTGIDPIELRRRNLITKNQMPFSRPIRVLGTELEYDSGDYALILDKALQHLRGDDITARVEQEAAGLLVGSGIALFVEKSGLGPYDGVKMRIDAAGHVHVITGAASVGQGVETVIAQICAESLGVGIDSVSVSHGQTDEIEKGLGAFASRVTVMTGTATHMASLEMRKSLLDAAAERLEVDPRDLDIIDGQIAIAGVPNNRMSVASLVTSMASNAGELDERTSSESWFTTDHMAYPYGVHAATVAVDADTGGIKVLKYLVVYDVGRAVNPRLVEGQIVGGAAQGLGGALLEEFLYDADGQPLATSFMDYLIPTSAEVPQIEVLLTEDAPSPLNPLGLKGAGEGGTTAFGAAIAAAVDDAIGIPLSMTELPLTPQRVRASIRASLAR